MPERCRVAVCGFDPMLLKGYVVTGFRGLWWHISDELYEEYQVKPNSKISGRLLGVYDGDGNPTAAPDEPFEWQISKESGLAVLIPYEVISKYKLTEFHFLEVIIEKINDEIVYPDEERLSKNYWPDDKMKLTFGEKVLGYLQALYR